MAGVNLDASVPSQDIIDFLKLTREHYPPAQSSFEVLSARHRFNALNRWFQQDKVEMSSGSVYRETVYLNRSGSLQAAYVNPWEPVDPWVRDNTAVVQIPLRKMTSHWTMEWNEHIRNREPDAVGNLDNKRRLDMQADVAELIEQRAFKRPDSSSDQVNPYGIPYYIVPITAEQAASDTQDHQGANPTYEDGNDIGACAGIDASNSDYDLYQNYNARWPNDDPINDFNDDCVQRIIRMHRHLRFEVPMNADNWREGRYADQNGYVTEELLDAMEQKARVNNDSLQADLGKFSGQVVVKGVPLIWCEPFDDWTNSDGDSAQTFMLVNHAYFKPIVFEGDYFRTSDPMNDVRTPDIYTTYEFLTHNYYCVNRRLAGGRIDVEPTT